jgi:hypothetical protein
MLHFKNNRLTNAGQKYWNRNPVVWIIRCFNRTTTVLYFALPKLGQQKARTMHTCNWRIQKNTSPKSRESATPLLNQKPVILIGFAPVQMGNRDLLVVGCVGILCDAIWAITR